MPPTKSTTPLSPADELVRIAKTLRDICGQGLHLCGKALALCADLEDIAKMLRGEKP